MSESNNRRNPYLVLGLPYGASVGEVRKAFARRSKEITQGSIVGVSKVDLTWALSQLERGTSDPTIDVSIYRVPANHSLFDHGSQGSNSVGFLNPAAIPILRTTESVTAEHIDELTSKALLEWANIFLSTNGPEIKIPYPLPK